jgi:hypothetical protein
MGARFFQTQLQTGEQAGQTQLAGILSEVWIHGF